jgi:GH15 family glucan-1,4-alpha-glucosidase
MAVDPGIEEVPIMIGADYQPIEDYGLIGDMHTVALVGKDGSIDFMSFPNFDSPTIFAALLDRRRGGRFFIAPDLSSSAQKQLYLPDTNVLITRWLSAAGVAEITDFMPAGRYPLDHRRVLVRRVKCVRGEVLFDLRCEPRFDYGRATHTVHARDGQIYFTARDEQGTALRLHHQVPLEVRDGAAVGQFKLSAGQTAAFVLEEATGGLESVVGPHTVSDWFKDTVNFWRTWMGHSRYSGRWQEIVHRSALVLKLLVSHTHGSLIAAPTCSLPEELGGVRNRDYRYTWIRDASFTLYALIRLGYTDEAGAFMRWIADRCMDLNADGSMQIMYGYDGRKVLTEQTLPHLEGYRGTAPVRIGNGAYNQLQLDIYGELMDAVYLYNKYGELISDELWSNLVRLVDYVCANWHRPDEGIWEVRGGQQEFLYSRLMCWVAIDRGIRLGERRSMPYPRERWYQTRDQIYQEIFTEYFDDARQAFIQHKGAKTLDASNLLMPLVRFISPTDPKWRSTLRAMEEELVDDSLVYRYRTSSGAADGLHGEEGTFTMCSFWYCEVLARSGDLPKARFLFEKMLGYANHLGLYAEELGPHGEHLGNFPQAFTHLGLISAAYAIDRKLSDAGWIG